MRSRPSISWERNARAGRPELPDRGARVLPGLHPGLTLPDRPLGRERCRPHAHAPCRSVLPDGASVLRAAQRTQGEPPPLGREWSTVRIELSADATRRARISSRSHGREAAGRAREPSKRWRVSSNRAGSERPLPRSPMCTRCERGPSTSAGARPGSTRPADGSLARRPENPGVLDEPPVALDLAPRPLGVPAEDAAHDLRAPLATARPWSLALRKTSVRRLSASSSRRAKSALAANATSAQT